MPDFRPFSLAVAGDGASLWLVDWAYSGWLATARGRAGSIVCGTTAGRRSFRSRVPPPGTSRIDCKPSTTPHWRSAWNRSEFWRGWDRQWSRCWSHG